MRIDFNEIKELLQTVSLTEISKKTGLPLRTLENYKHSYNNSFINMENTLTKLQKYYNEERNNMKLYSVLRDKLDNDNLPEDNEVIFETNDFEEAQEEYNQLVEEIKKYDQKRNGASLMKRIDENDYETVAFYVFEA